MKPIITRITQLSIMPQGEPLFGELCTHARIIDESAGELVEIAQQSTSLGARHQTIQISPEEWEPLQAAVDQLMEEIRKNNTSP